MSTFADLGLRNDLLHIEADRDILRGAIPEAELSEVLQSVTEDLHHVPHWVSGGTALGLIRDGALIPTDSDVDLCFLADWDNPPPLDEFPAMLEAVGGRLFRTTTYDGKPSQVAGLVKGRILDFYYCYSGLEPGFLWMLAQGACIRKPAHLIANRALVDTPLGAFWLPQPAEEYVEWRYGTMWRTPESDISIWGNTPARRTW